MNGKLGTDVKMRHPKFGSVRRGALAKIKIEAVRIGNNGSREGVLIARRFFKAIPELVRA